MKKIILALCALSAGSAFAASTTQSGTIHLNGYIYSATCDIQVNNKPFADNVTIDMGRHPTSAFNSKGDETGWDGFNGIIDIKLHNCPDTGRLSVSFQGTTMSGDSTILKLDNPTDSGTAKNLGIHLYDMDEDKLMRMDGSEAFSANVTNSESYTKDFWATYVSTEDTVTPGTADATLGFTIEYN